MATRPSLFFVSIHPISLFSSSPLLLFSSSPLLLFSPSPLLLFSPSITIITSNAPQSVLHKGCLQSVPVNSLTI